MGVYGVEKAGGGVDGLLNNDEKVASFKKHIQFKTRVLNKYPLQDQNGQNRYPIHDQKSRKTLSF